MQAGLAMGRSLRSIGADLGRCASTLSRERQRNRLLDGGQGAAGGCEQSTFPCTGEAASVRASACRSAEGSVWESGVVAGAQLWYGALSGRRNRDIHHSGRALGPVPICLSLNERIRRAICWVSKNPPEFLRNSASRMSHGCPGICSGLLSSKFASHLASMFSLRFRFMAATTRLFVNVGIRIQWIIQRRP